MSESVGIRITESLDKDDWDRFVNSNPRATLFQTTSMAEVYKRTAKYKPLSIAAVNERTNEVLATLLVVIKKEKNGFLGSFSTHSSIRGGPIFDDSQTGITAASELIKYYEKKIGKKSLYTRIHNLYDIPQLSSILSSHNYKFEGYLNYLIDLRKTKNELWSELSKSRKRGIRYAKRQNLIVEVVEDKKLIAVFYECLTETYKNVKIPLPDISLFESVFDVLVPANMAQIFLVKHDKEYVCGRVVLLFNKTIYAWYRGTKSDYLNLYPNDLVGWDTIERYHEKGYNTFDFGGAGTTNEMQGIRDFKAQFGGKLVNYGRYTKIHQPKKLRFSEKMFKVYRKLILR